MRLFEFEAKALLKGYGIPIPSSKMARSVERDVHRTAFCLEGADPR